MPFTACPGTVLAAQVSGKRTQSCFRDALQIRRPCPDVQIEAALMPTCRVQGESDDEAVLRSRQLDAATDKLSKQLRALEGLALKVGRGFPGVLYL